METEKKTASGGVSLLTVVQVVFVILKLTNLIDWPWKTVLIPLWIELGLIGLILVIALVVAIIDSLNKKR